MIGSDPDSSHDSATSSHQRPQDVQATFCATVVDEWIELGITHAVVAPGSRSTPMAIALASRPDIEVHVVHDERSAGFVALGLGIEGIPAVLLCTSGTAAANFFPAVVEAGLSAIPMIVLTADRPDELRGVGAPQTIDQIELYGSHVRWFHDAEVPHTAGRDGWRTLAAQAWHGATNGPVQLNLPFREPLLGVVGPLPDHGAPASANVVPTTSDGVPASANEPRGLIVVGGRSGVAADQVAALSARTGWPILADPLSEMRHLDGVITHFESLLRSESFADRHRPTFVARVGRPATSKTLAQWIDRAVADAGATLVQVGGPGLIDPGHNVSAVCTIEALLDVVPQAPDLDWRTSWNDAETRAALAVSSFLASEVELSEPGAAHAVATHLPAEARLVVASSMPVRDLEWFAGAEARAYCNRGANGIDGVTSTALGIALSGHPTVVLIGDLAFTHDSNALTGLATRGADLRIVVVDNDGGGIFSFLPQAATLDHDRFEQLFGTPLGVDVLGLAAAHHIGTHTVSSREGLASLLARPGPWVARVPSNRRLNVEVHEQLHRCVTVALDRALRGG